MVVAAPDVASMRAASGRGGTPPRPGPVAHKHEAPHAFRRPAGELLRERTAPRVAEDVDALQLQLVEQRSTPSPAKPGHAQWTQRRLRAPRAGRVERDEFTLARA